MTPGRAGQRQLPVYLRYWIVTGSIMMAGIAHTQRCQADGLSPVQLQALLAAGTASSSTTTDTLARQIATAASNVAATAVQTNGGDVSLTNLVATGTTAARTQADRAADTVNVMDFGARGDDVTDDATAINAALAFARTKSIGRNGPYVQTSGPYSHIVFPSGHRFKISSTLNFTGFSGNGFDVDMLGSSIDCHATGKICIDATGDNEMRFHSVRVVGDPTDMPKIGIQIGRTDNLLTSADNSTFDNIAAIGQFSFAAFYSFAAETTTFIHPEFWNYSGIPGSYALVEDNYNHFNIQSAFQTITAIVDKPSSSNENVFIGADIRSNNGQTIPIWLGGMARLSFIRSYAAGGGTACSPTCYGAVIFNEAGVYNKMLHLDVHFETSGLTDVFLIAGDPQQSIYGLDYLDHGPESSNSIFKLDSNVTAVTLSAADISIPSYFTNTTKLLDAPSAWSISGRYASGSSAGFNAVKWQGPIISGPSMYVGNYGPGPLQTQIADSTQAGGSQRGPAAVDWQSWRTNANQVASGSFSTIGGGQNNSASGAFSTIPGGVANTVSSQFGSALGYSNLVSGVGSTALGTANTASAASSLAAGTAASDNGNNGTFAWANGSFSTNGDATAALHILRASGTAMMRLTADGQLATSATCLAPPAGSSYAFSILLEARDTTTAGNDYVWTVPLALLTRDTTAATTSLVLGAPMSTSRGSIAGAAVSATADTTNGCLSLSFTPPTGGGDAWHAVARISTVEVR